MCFEIYQLDPARFLAAPGLAWQGALKQAKVKLDLLTNIDTLLMVKKKVSEEEYVMLFPDMQKLIKHTSKIQIKIKNHHILRIGT